MCIKVSAALRERVGTQRGFSLIELIMIIIMISIVAAFAMPRMFSHSPFEERGFYDGTLSAMRYAQRLAVASHCEVQVAIAENAYTITTREPTNNSCDSNKNLNFAVYNPATGDATYTGRLLGVTLTTATFSFLDSGRASASVTITIAGQLTRKICVTAETGFVEGGC